MKRIRMLTLLSVPIRTARFGAMAIALALLASGCLNENPVASVPDDEGVHSTVTSFDPGSEPGGVLGKNNPPGVGPPATGTVVEGVSVPGIALGSTRAHVEATYGDDTLWCQSSGTPGNRAYCAWAADGGGQVHVHFGGANGGYAENSPDDLAGLIQWTELVGGWTTTAGVTTTIAKEDPDAVIAAYPEARVTYTDWGTVYSIIDYPQGIAVYWFPNFYSGTVSIQMSIFYPREAPPLPEKVMHVEDIDLSARKSRGVRSITAFVRVLDDRYGGTSAEDAMVTVRWTYPDGTTSPDLVDATSSSGYAHFAIEDAQRGTHTLTVVDVVLDEFRFDRDNSVLSAHVKVK